MITWLYDTCWIFLYLFQICYTKKITSKIAVWAGSPIEKLLEDIFFQFLKISNNRIGISTKFCLENYLIKRKDFFKFRFIAHKTDKLT